VLIKPFLTEIFSSVAEPHHFDAAPALALSENFQAAPATKLTFLKQTKVNFKARGHFFLMFTTDLIFF
jgi:hypothetical protein